MTRHKNYNSLLIKLLGEKPIAFNPSLARASDSALAGLFMSQLLYWWGKGRYKGWVYKTIPEVHAETRMTRSEQDRAIRVWKSLDILEVQLFGIPRKRYFRIDEEKLVQLLQCNLDKERLAASAIQPVESSILYSRFVQANTESTTEDKNIDSSIQDGAMFKNIALDENYDVPF